MKMCWKWEQLTSAWYMQAGTVYTIWINMCLATNLVGIHFSVFGHRCHIIRPPPPFPLCFPCILSQQMFICIYLHDFANVSVYGDRQHLVFPCRLCLPWSSCSGPSGYTMEIILIFIMNLTPKLICSFPYMHCAIKIQHADRTEW